MLIVLVVAPFTLKHASAATGPLEVHRVLYLTQLGLEKDRPSPAVPFVKNITETSLFFSHPSAVRVTGVSISSPMVFSLWMTSNVSDVDVLLEGGLHEKLGETLPPRWINQTSLSQQRIDTADTLVRVNFTFSLPTQLLLVPYSQLGVSFKIPDPQPGVGIKVLYDSDSTPSAVVLRMSSYLALDGNRVDILDSNLDPTTTFNLGSNTTTLNNVVIFQVRVRSAFGFSDIGHVNLTVVAPSQSPLSAAANLTMSLTSDPTGDQPYTYTLLWLFPPNATQGVYQVYVDVIDAQGKVAFSFRGPTTFVLARGLYLPPSLIPYFVAGGAGGVGAVGGVLYYRRRKAKRYLVPFDHFNTLTGGEIDGGTVVTIEGNTGSGKTILSQQLMFQDLKNGRPCVFVATGDFPSNIRTGMKNLGLDVTGYEQSGLLTFVDGYSSEAGQESKEEFSVPSLGDLTTLGIRITSSLPSGSFKGGSLYFDSLTPLASKAKPESIVSLVQSVGARVKGMSGKAFFTIGPSVDSKVQRQLEELSDCVVQMEAFEEQGVRKSRLKIAKHRARKYQQGWVLYTVEDGKGLIFYSKKPRK